MKTLKLIGLMVIGFAFIMGCSGNNANLKNPSNDELSATQQKLNENWSNYNIRYNSVVIVFDFKNDGKKIIVHKSWSTVKDQETWTQLVNGTATAGFRLNQVWGNDIREIWVTDNQFYGYIVHQPRELVNARVVDDSTLRVIHTSSIDRRVWD